MNFLYADCKRFNEVFILTRTSFAKRQDVEHISLYNKSKHINKIMTFRKSDTSLNLSFYFSFMTLFSSILVQTVIWILLWAAWLIKMDPLFIYLWDVFYFIPIIWKTNPAKLFQSHIILVKILIKIVYSNPKPQVDIIHQQINNYHNHNKHPFINISSFLSLLLYRFILNSSL